MWRLEDGEEEDGCVLCFKTLDHKVSETYVLI